MDSFVDFRGGDTPRSAASCSSGRVEQATAYIDQIVKLPK